MPWYFPWSDSIKKRACRYLLQHYLGHFLKEKLTLDQLSVDLYKGTGTIQEVQLDVWSLNEALGSYSIPLEIVDGFIGSICVTIPWTALINDNTMVEIRNLEITVQPKQRTDNTTASMMLDSMFSMTSSIQLAQECLKQDATEGEQQADSAQPFEGLEMFAQTIEAVLSKVKVTFIDTIIRLEHLPKEAKTGAAVEVRISRIDYFDDLATDQGTPVDKATADKNVYQPAAVAHKNFHLMGVTIFTDEFPECQRTFCRSSANFSEQSSPQSTKMSDVEPSLSPPLSPKMTLQSEGSTDEGAQGSETGSSGKDSEPIKVAVLLGRQEVKLKLKQSEELPGPKLELDCQLGSVNFHMSPRQVHLVLEIAHGLASPGLCDDSNVRPRGTTNKPMQPHDYEKVEHELQKQLQQGRVSAQSNQLQPPLWREVGNLTVQSLEDSDDEMYFDLGSSLMGHSSMESSVSSTTTNKSSSTTTSLQFNQGIVGYHVGGKRDTPFQVTIPKTSVKPKVKSPKHKDNLQKLLDDPAAEVTRYRLKTSFLSVTILHEDPPATPSDGIDDPGQSSTSKLRAMAEQFFGHVQGINTSGTSGQLERVREQVSEACPHDHLGFLAKPLNFECNQKTSLGAQSIRVDLSLGAMELVECVFDRRGATSSFLGFHLPIDNILPGYSERLRSYKRLIYQQILVFPQDEVPSKPSMYSSMQSPAPCLHLQVHTIEKTHHSSRRGHSVPGTEVHLHISKCRSEIDVTIIDRIHALLNPQPLARSDMGGAHLYRSLNPNINQSRHAYFSQAMDDGLSVSDYKVDLHITSPSAVCTLRFPVPDLRTGQGADRLPWWRRNLRQEMLIAELTDADLQTTFSSAEAVSKFEFTCREAHGLFQEDPDSPPVSFIRISHGTTDDSPTADRDDGFDWPRLVVKVFPEMHSVLEEAADSDEDSTPGDSLNGACQFAKPEPSPFSSRKVMYENEEMVMPGDKQEMSEFQEKALANTRTVIELTLPNVNACLPTKQFFEKIYNRISNDLLLWEPLAPAPLDTQDQYSLMTGPTWGVDLAQQLLQQDPSTDRFIMCKSGIQYDSSSDSDEGTGQFYSVHEQKIRQKRRQRQEQGCRQSKICVNINISQGRALAGSPLKDENGAVRTDKQGELLLEVEEGNFLLVVSHNADPDLSCICIQAHRAALYHKDCVDIPTSWPVVERATLDRPGHLQPTIYLSENGMYTKLSGQVGQGGDSLDMLSMAISLKVDTFRSIKEIQVAIGIRGGTLQHRLAQPGQSWIMEALELFDVVDIPVLGYTPPKIVTELHLHLWSCAVDYRPLYLPLRGVLTVEAFSISSNIIAESPTSLLRFLVDDAALYISDKCSAMSVDLKKNYVCVADVGLFELSLRTSDGKDLRYPKLDLRASNNILHIRTCADSCRALQELIVYFANDGDLQPDDSEKKEGGRPDPDTQSVGKGAEDSSSSGSPVLSQSHMETVHDMMADAMKESTDSADSDGSSDSPGKRSSNVATKVFFFPDENSGQREMSPMAVNKVESPVHEITVAMEEGLEDSVTSSTVSEETEHFSADEEFCIIDDPGLGIAPRDGEPRIRMLVKEPIHIIDNHFKLPLGKTDQLKAPEHFPPAVYRYTLREMSLVWYMYGGRDFGADKTGPSKSSSKSSQQRAKSRGKSSSSKLGRLGWQARGGPNRDINTLMELQLNKARMQHEVFPESAEQASRQMLLIHELEIRDRLASSQINKFLYQYTSEAMPRQSHANMLVIKALHVRPDPTIPAQECSLKVSLLPLRLNIDQDALFFLRNFFTSITGEEAHNTSAPQPTGPTEAVPHHLPRPSTPPPVMQVGRPSSPSPSPDPQELLIMFDEITEKTEESEEEDNEGTPRKQPTFFKCFVFSPDVPIRLDYHGKHVDMEQGTFAGLLVGLAQLNCSELKLKRLNYRHGLLGLDRLILYTLNEWLQDIKKTQLPSILGGVGPMYSLVQLVQGIRDLFWLPVEQYRKDGRIVRGIQRGAHSFTTSTAMATLELTNRLVQTVQYAAELAYDMVSPGPSVRQKKHYKRVRKAGQPADLREGVTNAYLVVKEGISGTAQTIAKVARDEHEQKGVSGAVGGVLRQIPPTVIQPVILATEATSNVLGGMRNQLLPDKKREDDEKWKLDP